MTTFDPKNPPAAPSVAELSAMTPFERKQALYRFDGYVKAARAHLAAVRSRTRAQIKALRDAIKGAKKAWKAKREAMRARHKREFAELLERQKKALREAHERPRAAARAGKEEAQAVKLAAASARKSKAEALAEIRKLAPAARRAYLKRRAAEDMPGSLEEALAPVPGAIAWLVDGGLGDVKAKRKPGEAMAERALDYIEAHPEKIAAYVAGVDTPKEAERAAEAVEKAAEKAHEAAEKADAAFRRMGGKLPTLQIKERNGGKTVIGQIKLPSMPVQPIKAFCDSIEESKADLAAASPYSKARIVSERGRSGAVLKLLVESEYAPGSAPRRAIRAAFDRAMTAYRKRMAYEDARR